MANTYLEGQVLAMVFVMLVLSFTLPSAFVVSSAPNPLDDLSSAIGISVPGTSPQSAVTNANNSTNVRNQQAQNAGCAGSVITGAVGGGIIGSLVPGIGTLIGAGVGAVVGGLTGCVLLPTSVTQGFGNAIIGVANSLPGSLGDFTRGIVTVLNFVGALFKFGPDFIAYTAALLGVNPTIATILIVVESYTTFITILYIVKIARGVGMLG
jgi:hypothetical protein